MSISFQQLRFRATARGGSPRHGSVYIRVRMDRSVHDLIRMTWNIWARAPQITHVSNWACPFDHPCNTPLPEYVLSCVFRFFDRIFLIYFLYLFCIMNYLYERFVLDLDSRTRSQLLSEPRARLKGITRFRHSGIPIWPISVLNIIFQYSRFSMIFWNFPQLNWESSKPVSASTVDRFPDF